VWPIEHALFLFFFFFAAAEVAEGAYSAE